WLARLGVKCCVVEQQLVERAHVWAFAGQTTSTLPITQPYWCMSDPQADGCMVLARHQATAARIWDARTGYPGDGDYLDFHKRHYTSWLRYWRVTDNRLDMQYKLLYVPEWAQQKAAHHAGHFVGVVAHALVQEARLHGCFPVLCLPFDTELFGHWWFEGPMFLHRFLEHMGQQEDTVMWSLAECWQRVSPFARVRLPAGSWGKDAGHEPWANPQVRWMWHFLAEAEKRLDTLLRRFPIGSRSRLQERLLCQALRELLLLQSSDWSFLVVTGSAREYAEQRFVFHARDFEYLCRLVEESGEQENLLPEAEASVVAIEQRDKLFAELDVEWWHRPV
ncbi:MAG: DUF1957 domain-containing protein, partial [Candidatus Kapabacteria bacterium]|nr:DUF1957 domain-containing protein [Candidatus Kapabacteria bacterium]MDW7996646.1 DUF1957 domain-containing protein [Bacteroidota bacterium]